MARTAEEIRIHIEEHEKELERLKAELAAEEKLEAEKESDTLHGFVTTRRSL